MIFTMCFSSRLFCLSKCQQLLLEQTRMCSLITSTSSESHLVSCLQTISLIAETLYFFSHLMYCHSFLICCLDFTLTFIHLCKSQNDILNTYFDLVTHQIFAPDYYSNSVGLMSALKKNGFCHNFVTKSSISESCCTLFLLRDMSHSAYP